MKNENQSNGQELKLYEYASPEVQARYVSFMETAMQIDECGCCLKGDDQHCPRDRKSAIAWLEKLKRMNPEENCKIKGFQDFLEDPLVQRKDFNAIVHFWQVLHPKAMRREQLLIVHLLKICAEPANEILLEIRSKILTRRRLVTELKIR